MRTREAEDPRPLLTPALERILASLCTLPPLRGLEARSILVVAHGAHGTAAASVRSLRGVTRSCTVGRRRRLVELVLRPPFFHDGDAPRRLATLAHELLHLDPEQPGALLEENRHRKKSHTALERDARALAGAYLEAFDAVTLLCLAHEGEVRMRQWLHRPLESTAGRTFGDLDVFDGPLRMRTPPRSRGGWW